MTANIKHTGAQRALNVLRNCGPRGRALADELDRRGTRVWVTPKIYGGFTLNFVNTIFIYPLPANAGDTEFKYWVTLLGHEACHVEQRYWVDSVEQEIHAYTAQSHVADELGVDLSYIKDRFAHLDPSKPEDLKAAYEALLSLFGTTPAGIVYASLPLLQPVQLHAVLPAARQLAAVVRAGLKRPQKV
ncbi:MAG: hypothetical protein IT331_22045 [Anaerolineae bacterium]|nr:hypothetical protein [Anaerolineae bacterium]